MVNFSDNSGFGAGSNNSSTGVPTGTYHATSSKCHIKIFSFVTPITDPEGKSDKTMKVNVIDLSSEATDNPLTNFSFTKSNANPSGYFQFTLLPTANWIGIIKPGDWVVVYLTNGSTEEKIRCFGSVDCTTMSERIDSRNGARSITYNVSGRDFGKIFEKYMIYINIFVQSNIDQNELLKQVLAQDVINTIQGGPDTIIKNLINTFLGGKADDKILVDQQQLKQWHIPAELTSEITGGGASGSADSGGSRFLDILDLSNIQENLDGQKIITTLDVRSPLWQLLQGHANMLINEMFCEMTDEGKPAIYLRTIPFTFKDYTDPAGLIDGRLNKFLDLPSIPISGSIILNSEIGIHENDRISFLILTSSYLDSDSANPNSSMAYLTGKFPYVDVGACQRYGLNVFEYKTDFALKQGGTTQPDPNLLQSWNYLLKHWYENNSLFEHASMTIIGRQDVRLGKRVDVVDGPLIGGGGSGTTRSYYLESYVDVWEFGGFWSQTLTLTRGIFVKDGKEKFPYEVYQDVNPNAIGLSVTRRTPLAGGFS